GANLPANAAWGIKESVCTIDCPENQHVLDNKCVSKQAIAIFQDHCAQISDCLNCSLSDSCGWCDGSCKSIQNCHQKEKVFLADYFNPAFKCKANLTACGPQDHFEKHGNLTFAENTVYKNHICIWRITPPTNDNSVMRMSVNISA